LLLSLLCLHTYAIVVANTWGKFSGATKAAFSQLQMGKTRIDAVEVGCSWCEEHQCDTTVGFGGSPDENGETTLDAMILDGKTMHAGSVGDLRRIKQAISVARYVMDYTSHTLIVGDQATAFAKEMGFQEQSLQTPASLKQWETWKANNCQPNYRENVTNIDTCGPYHPVTTKEGPVYSSRRYEINTKNHDTIAMIAIDSTSNMAVGTSTNGANHKIPGRVGDSPIIGAGAYVDNKVGGCGATGDGDIMMRFLPCFKAVQNMKAGMNPTLAAENALSEIVLYFPKYVGALLTVNKAGESGGAAHGWIFTYAYQNSSSGPIIYTVHPKNENGQN